MTKNQIDYAKLLEERRSNLRQEELTQQRDDVARQLGFGNLSESIRHNQAQEAHQHAQLGEQIRANQENEALKSRQIGVSERQQSESERHNRIAEQLGFRQQSEVERSNLAREAETLRHNQAAESISRFQASEMARHNLQSENLTRLATEVQQLYNAGRIGLETASLSETIRNNEAKLAEQIRASKVDEQERLRSALVKEAENERYHRANEQITSGHYAEMESQGRTKLGIDMARAITGGVRDISSALGFLRKSDSKSGSQILVLGE